MELQVIHGEGPATPADTRKQKLRAALAALWVYTMELKELAEALQSRYDTAVPTCSRLHHLYEACNAWGGRFIARMAALGHVPLPVVTCPEAVVIEEVLARLDKLAGYSSRMSNLARKCMDPSAAWVLELNAAEARDYIGDIQQAVERSRPPEVCTVYATKKLNVTDWIQPPTAEVRTGENVKTVADFQAALRGYSDRMQRETEESEAAPPPAKPKLPKTYQEPKKRGGKRPCRKTPKE